MAQNMQSDFINYHEFMQIWGWLIFIGCSLKKNRNDIFLPETFFYYAIEKNKLSLVIVTKRKTNVSNNATLK